MNNPMMALVFAIAAIAYLVLAIARQQRGEQSLWPRFTSAAGFALIAAGYMLPSHGVAAPLIWGGTILAIVGIVAVIVIAGRGARGNN